MISPQNPTLSSSSLKCAMWHMQERNFNNESEKSQLTVFAHISLSQYYVPPTKVRWDILISAWILLVSASVSASQILVPTISLEPVDGIQPNLPGYIIRTSLRAD